MGIRVQDIIQDLSKGVSAAHQYLKEKKVAVSVPEVEITLNLEAELEGEMEKTPGARKKEEEVERTTVRRYLMDEKTFKGKGVVFRRIGTVHPPSKEVANLTLRVVFLPDEEQ